MLRRAAVAGSWYPDHPPRLIAELDRYLNAASADSVPAPPRALIVPHAGLAYSGPVAAFAYTLLQNASYQTIVLVGPSHFVPFHGVSVWPSGAWQTPLGHVAVDAVFSDALRAACAEVVELPAAHAREHSLEMQLPFLAHLEPGTPIVPLVMGHQTRATAFALGEALAHVVGDARVLVIASSDLSHYENAAVASAMDDVVMQRVAALDDAGLMRTIEREPRHACGGGPMAAVLRAARLGGATTARILRYADSGDVSGDKSSVVGYLAAAVF